MRVPEQIKKCVAFVGPKKLKDQPQPRGSVLFLGDHTPESKFGCMITARHVVEKIRNLGAKEVWLRVNRKAGGCEWISTDESDWIFPEDPSLDLAVHFGYLSEQADHMFLPRQLALTPSVAQAQNVGVGDDIFITGLFSSYAGKLRNVPIVRVGNLAAYPEERIKVRGFPPMDAYLIEARSFGGMSGSPVFYHAYASHISGLRPFAPHMYVPIPTPKPWTDDDVKAVETQPFYLMGIVHGHFTTQKENTGIVIVVPVEKILNFIDAERLKRAG